MATTRLEFTVEPFRDGAPGPHVQAAVEAVRARGIPVEMGPFSTFAEVEQGEAIEAVRALLEAAFAAGALRVSLQVTSIAEAAG